MVLTGGVSQEYYNKSLYMKHHLLMNTASLLLVSLALGLATAIACEETPRPISISVSGAQPGNEQNYYVVEIPDQGTTTVTVTGSGQTPCPTDEEKCRCQHNTDKLTPEEDGDPKFTFSPKGAGTQDPNNGPSVVWEVDSSTSPGEYKFKVTKIEQAYKACPQGWNGGIASKSNTQESEEVTILAYKIETETVVSVPQDKARTTVGVAEEINVIFYPSNIDVGWVVDNSTDGGTVLPASGTVVLYKASMSETTGKLIPMFKGCQDEISFTIKAPSSIYLEYAPNTSTNIVSATQLRISENLNIYIGPESVNFSYVDIAEGPCSGSGTGYFSSATNPHIPKPPANVTSNLINGKGWQVAGVDHVSTFYCNAPFAPGKFSWPIPWKYQKGGLATTQFATVDQNWEITMNASKATLTMRKLQYTASISQP